MLEGFLDSSAMMQGGVYALAHHREIVYIGKAKNFLARIYTHRSVWSRQRKGDKIASWLPVKGIIFDQIYLRPCRPDLADDLERSLIAKHNPKHNDRLRTQPHSPFPEMVIRGVHIGAIRPKPEFERRI